MERQPQIDGRQRQPHDGLSADDNDLVTRELFLDALRGVGVPVTITRQGAAASLIRFTGNQHNESFAWDEAALADTPTDLLMDLYTQAKLESLK